MPVFVNNVEISDDDVHTEMQHHQAATMEEARGDAARALVVKHLLLEAAVDQEFTSAEKLEGLDNESEERIIEGLIDSIIKVPDADDETCQRHYDKFQQSFVDQKTGELLPYDMVKNHIKTYLEDMGHMAALRAYIDSLMDKAQIVGLA
ncbi:MAG: hypothetical protein HOJ34_02105 [Kordiimonadaceae bacterium]|jgi:hypothetical protein|nr:hypothetical protein [Kordiimonadaceae bacterium]MBT6328550.1 hypothetical protein [Kordiimonadaceae bacterium]MBT7582611.1 hypothetical protein [Kordiimonadaceae bacterium]